MKKVAVIGAGITGIQASLDLLKHGVEVYLIEKEPFIGGHATQIDKIFPTGDSSRCVISAKMNEVYCHPDLHLHTMTEVTGLSGTAGNFTIKMRKHPRYVDINRCTGCCDCTDICPVEVYNKYDAGIGVRKAIYKSYRQAVPDIVVRDSEHCIDCGLCYDVCANEAILRDSKDTCEDLEIKNITSVIVCTGYTMYSPSNEPRYRYLTMPDVITSLEFERMLDPEGPTGGEIKRLSNGEIPKSIVFIQCVGSRNAAICRNFCSAVCCMYTIKDANAVKEKYGDNVDVTILKSDTRAYGKGYQEYNRRIKKTHTIQVLRCMPGSIESGDGKRMRIVVEKVKKGDSSVTPMVILEPELVVLSASLSPSVDAEKLAEIMGISGSEDRGFFSSANHVLDPTGTSNQGIYIAGCAVAPKDINDCINQGEAAAMKAFIDTISQPQKDGEDC